MSTKQRRTKRKKQAYTLSEFKTWLDGYCSAHPTTWSPTAEQWKLINEKLFSIVEPEPVVNTPEPYVAPYAAHAPPVQYASGHLQEPAPFQQQPRSPDSGGSIDPMKEFSKEANDTKSDFI